MAEGQAGGLVVRLAEGTADLRRAQALRGLCFRARTAAAGGGDADRFDALSCHVLIEDADGRLLGCFRHRLLRGPDLGDCYTAQHYDLTGLRAYALPMVEVGRFCIHPQVHDPDILRLAWAALARLVEVEGAGLLFGCTSFPGVDPARHAAALALLAARHLAPPRWRPGRRAPEVVALAAPPGAPVEGGQGQAGLPPLLRSYLAMGGWVGDHAVIDRDLDTLHVFTGLETRRVPPARRRRLRDLAAAMPAGAAAFRTGS